MTVRPNPLLAGLGLFGSVLLASPTNAQTAPAATASASDAAPASSNSVGADIFYSSDAEGTDVIRAGLNLDVRNESSEEYLGVRVERARFNPLGDGWRTSNRIYLRAADQIGRWKWNARVGTDGDTLLGAATIHNEARFRQEFFVERDVVETPQGLDRGIYSTFAGVAQDLPVDDRNIFTVVAGLQEFTGRNERIHLRANYIHVVKPEWGLSAQLRTRYFRSSEPGEYDYYSPRWYAEVLPVVQLRRYSGGWRYTAATGLGAQRDSGSRWRQSRYASFRITSPTIGRQWAVEAGLVHSNQPSASGTGYSYTQANLGLTRRF